MVVGHARTLGVDLAAQAKQTAVCVVSWEEGRATVGTLAVGADDVAIVDLIESEKPAKVAIDAPFGWPAPFVSAVTEHAAGAAWAERATQKLRLRTTDLHVIIETGQQPLSVSSDRIAMTAFRCAGLLSGLAKSSHRVERAGSGLVVEVYPAAALRQWGIDPRGYKGTKPEQQGRRAQLVVELVERSRTFLSLTEETSALLAASDHLLDALVCALIARAAHIGSTLAIPDVARALAEVEGWIALPERNALSKLGDATVGARRA